jgi:ribosomal protein S18 acetylase RimI-like enzyme
MRRFSGRAGRGVGTEIGKSEAVKSVRRFRPEDLDAVTAIGNEAPEAATWSRESYKKFAEENGSLALVLETNGRVSGFLVLPGAGRRGGDNGEKTHCLGPNSYELPLDAAIQSAMVAFM